MSRICRYHLNEGSNALDLPSGATVLSVGWLEAGICLKICLWAEVEPSFPTEQRYFEVFPTGYDLPDLIEYPRLFIGTVSILKGALVWHIFEKTKATKRNAQ